MITDYVLVSGTNENLVVKKVRKYIANGWQPLGGIGIDYHPNGTWGVSQAMVKYDQKN